MPLYNEESNIESLVNRNVIIVIYTFPSFQKPFYTVFVV